MQGALTRVQKYKENLSRNLRITPETETEAKENKREMRNSKKTNVY